MNKYKADEARAIEVWREAISIDDLQQLRRQLAKQANQRMVRLEQATSKITGENYTFGAYDKAQEYLDSQGRRRFSESKNFSDDVYDLKKEITQLQGFLNSESSRVGGMRQIEERRMEAFREKGIKTANTKEFYDFLNSESFIKLTEKAGFDSEDVIELYEKYSDKGLDPEDIQAALDDFRGKRGRKTYKGLIKQLDAKVVSKRKRKSRRNRK